MHTYFKKSISILFILSSLGTITACSGFFDKDNTPTPTPLTSYKAEVMPRLLWSTSTGYASSDDTLRMNPVLADGIIYTSGYKGAVTAIDSRNGQILWHGGIGATITSGPGVGNGIVVVGSRRGEVVALDQRSGHVRWRKNVEGEVLASPTIGSGIVLVKTVDGAVLALDATDGHEQWSYLQPEPNLVLRGASAPLIADGQALVGFEDGNLAKFTLHNGRLLWMQPIATPEGAFAIQRMIDIDADPILYDQHLYAATYQGQIASLNWQRGTIHWSRDISSYTGMVADPSTVYITDAKGSVWAFNAADGHTNWRNNKLLARVLSGPAQQHHYVVVGDGEGYLHWLNKEDGHLAARIKVGDPIYATPLVQNNVLYVLTNSGVVSAYTLHSPA